MDASTSNGHRSLQDTSTHPQVRTLAGQVSQTFAADTSERTLTGQVQVGQTFASDTRAQLPLSFSWDTLAAPAGDSLSTCTHADPHPLIIGMAIGTVMFLSLFLTAPSPLSPRLPIRLARSLLPPAARRTRVVRPRYADLASTFSLRLTGIAERDPARP